MPELSLEGGVKTLDHCVVVRRQSKKTTTNWHFIRFLKLLISEMEMGCDSELRFLLTLEHPQFTTCFVPRIVPRMQSKVMKWLNLLEFFACWHLFPVPPPDFHRPNSAPILQLIWPWRGASFCFCQQALFLLATMWFLPCRLPKGRYVVSVMLS